MEQQYITRLCTMLTVIRNEVTIPSIGTFTIVEGILFLLPSITATFQYYELAFYSVLMHTILRKTHTNTLSSCHHTPWRVTGCHSCLKVVCVSLSACSRSIGGRMALFILVWCHVLWFDLSVNPPVSWCTSSYSILCNMLSSQCDSLWIRNFLSQLIACFPQLI